MIFKRLNKIKITLQGELVFPLWLIDPPDPDEMERSFWLFVLMGNSWFNQQVAMQLTLFFTLAGIIVGTFITVVLVMLYKTGVFSH